MHRQAHIPFNRPHVTGNEFAYISDAMNRGHLSGNGAYTKQCSSWLEEHTGCAKAILVHSGTAALEMMALLADIGPGDEVIMPSFTFVSTANAFVLRGAVPVFVDIEPDTLNIAPAAIARAVTAKTKAIVVVHYAGIACDMTAIAQLASKHNLLVLEDAAHALGSFYNNKALGSFGALSALSFHETKNVICGEGGALLINDPQFIERAEVMAEKGTDRTKFSMGLVDKYVWQDLGSSFHPSEIETAFLWAQMEQQLSITKHRLAAWHDYHELFEPLEKLGLLKRPAVPRGCDHNAHLYYLLLKSEHQRAELLSHLHQKNVGAVFHYVPLHSSPAGLKYGRVNGDLSCTDEVARCILRLPLWVGLTKEDTTYIADCVYDYFQLCRISFPSTPSTIQPESVYF